MYDFNDNNYHDLDDDNTTTATRIPKNPQNAARFSERQLGDLEILAQSMLFFAVGHETTATLLSSCGLFLSLHPDLQERLYAEVHEAFEAEKKSQTQGISYERLMELQYLDAFISEALRYFTPTLNFDREASEDVEIEVEGKRILIPKGMGVVIPFHAVHHDPLNYEDPERFDPERFMPQNKDKIKPCTFIPFGSGPRYCLASRFALIEAKLALATLVNRFRFVRSEGTIWPPKYRHHYMLLQMEWPKIRFVDRTLDSNILGSNGRAQMAA